MWNSQMARPQDYPRTREAEKNLGKFIRKFNLVGRVWQPILISCDEECCNGVPINLARDYFFRASGSPSERSVPQAELFSCIENSRQQGRAPRWMRVFDKKGSRGPPPDHPSRDLANLAKLHLIHRWLMRLNPSNHGGGKCHLQCVNIDQAANGGRDK